MNDRYLFKAKDNLHKEWHIGNLFKEPDGMYIREMHRDLMVCIDTSTISQCTGLKDKNGKLIWENDVVRTVYDGIEHIYQVIWDESELNFKATNGKENYESNFEYLTCCDEVEVIGNKFDNPELLKECDDD